MAISSTPFELPTVKVLIRIIVALALLVPSGVVLGSGDLCSGLTLGGVSLDMNAAQVERSLGPPDLRTRLFDVPTVVYAGDEAELTVLLKNDLVVLISLLGDLDLDQQWQKLKQRWGEPDRGSELTEAMAGLIDAITWSFPNSDCGGELRRDEDGKVQVFLIRKSFAETVDIEDYRQAGREDVEVTEGQPLLAGVGSVTNPRLIPSSKVQPRYPREAREDGVRAVVVLQAVVHKDGTVGDLVVLKSDPAKRGFEEAAVEAVQQWRYEPATLEGKPVDVFFIIVVQFEPA